MSGPNDPLALARDLAARTGLAEPAHLERLTGGRNNQAFRVTLEDATDVVLKLYHHDPRDTRDRLRAEWNFLTYVWERGVRNVPQPIVKDDASHAALIGFVAGEKRKPGTLIENDVAQAADFIAAINTTPRDVMALNPGSEACVSIEQHIETVTRRVARLDQLDPTAPHASAAQAMIDNEVQPAWIDIKSKAFIGANLAGVGVHRQLDPTEMCVSPSDFGFHNALADKDGALTFIDFEYAGRDDPAKLICDFLCTPEIPLPGDWTEQTIIKLARAIDGDSVRERARLLLPVYRIKWICIMLNEFLPIGGARRDFAERETREQRCTAQLEKVRHALDQLNTP